MMCKGDQSTIAIVVLAATAGVLALTSFTAIAQDAPPQQGAADQPAGALDEVIVTAQRREESLQDVPIAVTPLSAEELEARGITGLQGLTSGAVPSLNVLQFAGRPAELQFSVRGVGMTDPSQASFEPAIAVYVDGVYLSRGQGSGLELIDLERIEVLRGPQGTLYGRNAVAGAINMVAKKPSGQFGFKTTLDYEFEFESIRSKTTLETPAAAGVSFKLDYLHNESDGWTTNPAPGQRDLSTVDNDAYRIAARWKPSDTFVLDYAYDNSELSFTQTYNHLLENTPIDALVEVAPGVFFGFPAGRTLAPFVHTERQEEVPGPGLYAPRSISEANGHSLIGEWAMNESWTFKSITAYRELEDLNRAINGFGILSPTYDPATQPIPSAPNPAFLGGITTAYDLDQEQTTQEFQLFYNSERWQWTFGATYYNEKSTSDTWTILSQAFVGTGSTAYSPVILASPIQTPKTVTLVDSTSYGAYGQATWTPAIAGDRLHLTAGARWSDDDKDLTRTQLNGVPTNQPVNYSVSRVDPAATVAFDFTDDFSVYVRGARAYRGGGASVRETPDPNDPTDSGFNPFQEEEVWSYELGLKSEFWDGRARLNGALFRQDYKDKQASFQKPNAVANTRIFNIDDEVKIEGLELELTLAPIDNLTISLGGTLMRSGDQDDGTYVVTNPLTGTPETVRLAQFAEERWSANLDYQFPETALGHLAFNVGVTDSSDYCFNERSCIEYPSVSGGADNMLVNARLSLSRVELGSNAGALQIALWGKNLTDEEWQQFGFTVPGFGTGVVNYGEPRTFGAALTYEF